MWTIATLWGMNPDKVWVADPRSGNNTVMLGTMAVITGLCSFIRVRFFLLWIVPVCAWSTYLLLAIFVGLPFPDKLVFNVSVLAVVCFMTLFGAWHQERHKRDKWSACHRLVEVQVVVQEQLVEIQDRIALANAVEAVLHVLCDFVVKLTVSFRIFDSSPRFASFLGRDVEGLPFTELMVGEEKARWETAAAQASSSGTPAVIHATLRGRLSKAFEATLILVNTERSHLCHLIVGIRMEREEESMHSLRVIPELLRGSCTPDSAPSEVLVQSTHENSMSQGTTTQPLDDIQSSSAAQTCTSVHPTELGKRSVSEDLHETSPCKSCIWLGHSIHI
mmetsp:Transcript_124918/g.230369  ORF Transcript_124918/g.230369 Transcript_124918/m.230369 type:complete len:334 (+) Transcript_124918:2-1003(+)